MARVPAVELERLKRTVSVQRLAEAKGATLTKRGDDEWSGRCPLHDDEGEGFTVSAEKNLWHCETCGGGSAIDFVMQAEGVTFRHAVELLREGADFSKSRPITAPKLSCPLDADVDDATLLRQVRDYYRQQLDASPEALAWLDARGLKQPALIEAFGLGFANRTLGLRLPEANRVDGAKLRGRLQALGVYRESGHEHLNGSVVVSLCDEGGAVASLYGRKVTDNLRSGTPKHLCLPGAADVLFNAAGLAEGSGAAIVCGAVLDALAFWAAGFRHVTVLNDEVGSLSLLRAALAKHQVTSVFLAHARDDAGDAAAAALAGQLAGIDCYRVQFPRGLDAVTYAVKVVPATKSLGVALRHAVAMGEGVSRRVPVAAAVSVALDTLVAAPPPAPSAGVEARPSAAALSEGVGPESEQEIHPLPATAPTPTPTTPTLMATEDEGVVVFGPRRYRLRGLLKPHAPDALRLNVVLQHNTNFHVDTFDLYSAKARLGFVQQAAHECGLDVDTVKRDVGQVLLQVEALLDKRREEAKGPKIPVLTDEERDAALELLRAPELLTRVLEDFGKCGVVGEETNKLVGYLAAVSRKLEEPLAVLIQSSSAAGKSSLMEAVLAFIPEEEKTKYSAMTGQSLFYMGDVSLRHKVLAVVEEEGASRASYALKLLQSEGELTIASTGKDPHTGRLVTHEYRVEGPTQLFLTTTATHIDEELLNRCLVLTVDEERAQTSAIHQRQRHKRTLEGRLEKREKDATLKLHQDAQRLLRPLAVVNPYATQLTFPDAVTRARRDFPKYLTLIEAIALLHQYQRPVKTAQSRSGPVDYVEVTLADIATANRLAASVLGRTLDTLPPQTRRLLSHLESYLQARADDEGTPVQQLRFTRREVREALTWGDTQLKVHLARLVDLELLATLRTPHGFSYALRAHETGAPVMGLADGLATTALPVTTTNAQSAGRGGVGLQSAPWPTEVRAEEPSRLRALPGPSVAVGLRAQAHSTAQAAAVHVHAGES